MNAVTDDAPPSWTSTAMRSGFAGRALVYVIVGTLAVIAAWRGGEAQGTTSVLEQLRGSPWGLAALALIALGMIAYAVWRFIGAGYDLDAHGRDGKGVIARLGMTVSGIVHLGIGLYAAALLIGIGTGGSGGGSGGLTGKLMEQPFGRWIIGIAGVCVIGAGIYYFHKGLSGKYRAKLIDTSVTRKLDPVMRFGLMAQGVVIGIIGGTMIWAAWTYDPEKAGGLGQALDVLRSAAFGQILLVVVALGLVAFAVFCAVMAIYGTVPRAQSDDVPTLARRMEARAGA